MVRRLFSLVLVLATGLGSVAGLIAALLGTGAASAAPMGAGGGCSPTITGYTKFQVTHNGVDPSFTLYGNCFGTGPILTASTTPYFRVVVFDRGTTLSFAQKVISSNGKVTGGWTNPLSPQKPGSRWNGCSSLVDGLNGFQANGVSCTVTRWSDKQVTLASYGGLYGQGYTVAYGDLLVAQIWDPQTGAGPADLYLRAGYPGRTVPANGGGTAGPGGNGTGNPQVSSIGASLPRVTHAFSNVTSDVVDGAIALALALFITFPANLFNSTFEENYADIVAWWRKWTDIFFPEPVRRSFKKGTSSAMTWALSRLKLADRSPKKELKRENVTFVGVLLVGSLLGALLDPVFGFNTRTVLSYVAIVIAMVAGVFISGLTTSGYHRAAKHGKVPYKLEALPVGLVIAAVCVIISRASGFAPGYLYGVICGVAFGRQLAKREEGHLVAISSLLKVLLAVLACVAWDSVTANASQSGSFFGTVLLDDFLASLFVSSLVGTLISLLPLRFLPGHKLQSWHKGAWLAVFGVTLFVLIQVLLRPHSTSSGPSHAPLVTTAMLFVVFGVGSVLFRQHFARKAKRGGDVAEVEGGVINLDEPAEAPTPVPAPATGEGGPRTA